MANAKRDDFPDNLSSDLSEGEIAQYKEQVGPLFNDQNILQNNGFEQDKLDKIVVSKEFCKLAAQDIKTYEKRLQNRLQFIPLEWREEGLRQVKREDDHIGKFTIDRINDIPFDVAQNVKLAIREVGSQLYVQESQMKDKNAADDLKQEIADAAIKVA